MKRIFSKHSISQVPQTPGVYKYFDSQNNILYIGKANNLRSRMYSYTLNNLHGKTKDLVGEIKTFEFVLVDSEVEALLLEARLIGTYKPKYNVSLRDDKKPLCIRITNDKYPQILTARNQDKHANDLAFYGPFPSSYAVISILRLLRNIFPFAQHKLGDRPCLYSQLGLCNPCPNAIEKLPDSFKLQQRKIYKKNINRIKLVLDGNFPSVMHSLKKQMNAHSLNLEFEQANLIKRQINQLEYVIRPKTNISAYLKDPNFLEDTRYNQLTHLQKILSESQLNYRGKLSRIECFDIAHLSGTAPTASMVTFIDGIDDKKYYRHFRISKDNGGSDTASLSEVIKRRSKYFGSWGRPDLIIVDGGKPQVSVFVDELKNYGIPVVGIAKRFENLIIPNSAKEYQIIKLTPPALYLVQKIRDEAHRFARRYHHHLIKKSLLLN